VTRVLVIGDLHLPAERDDYLAFCRSIRKKYKTTETVFIGDVLDHHAISFHQKHPEADSATAEYHRCMEKMKAWKKSFPTAKICIGNHDERIHRLSSSVGIPAMYLKDYKAVFDTPTWEWNYEWCIDNICYIHGTGTSSGNTPAFNAAKARLQSTVSGHIHSVSNICWCSGPSGSKLFGFNVPCGVDKDHQLMYYSKNFLKKPVNGAGVVIDGHPYMEIMNGSNN
jgi:predicted phosphodiesterase